LKVDSLKQKARIKGFVTKALILPCISKEQVTK